MGSSGGSVPRPYLYSIPEGHPTPRFTMSSVPSGLTDESA